MKTILECIGIILLTILFVVLFVGIYFGAIWVVLKLIFMLFGFGQYLTWQIVLGVGLIGILIKMLFR